MTAKAPAAKRAFRSATGSALGRMNLRNVYANGQQVAGLDEAGKLDVLSRMTAFSNSESGRTQVVVQAGEDLRNIAQRVYGNANLWYVIAAANALEGDGDLVAGTTLTVPEVKTSSNDASTFKPYNPGEITGPTSPGLPYIEPPDKGCGTLGMIIMAVVIIVVTVYTAGAATAALGAGLSTGASAGTMALGGAALTGGTTLTALGAVTVGGIAGAAGALAGQAVGSAMGVSSFSWRNVAAGGVTGALTAGLASTGAISKVADLLGGTRFAQGAVGAVASNLVSQAGSRIAGVDTSFSWRSIAASAVTGGLTAQATPFIGRKLGIDLTTEAGQRIADMVGGTVGGVVGLHVRRHFGLGGDVDYRQIVADAFGNMLGNAATGKHGQWAMDAKLQDIWNNRSEFLLASVGDGGSSRLGGYDGPVYDNGRPVNATNLDTVSVYPDHTRTWDAWTEWTWRQEYNAWVGDSQLYARIPAEANHAQARAVFNYTNFRWKHPISWAEMSGDVRRSNEIDFSGFNANNAIPIGPTPQPVTRTIPTPSIGPVQRQQMSALDTTLSVVTQLAKFSIANSDRNLLAVKDGMNWVRERSKGMVDNANSPWEAAAGSVLYAINSVTNSVVSGTVDMARLTTSHQERAAFVDGMTTLFTTDPRKTASAAWGQWNELSYDDKLSNIGAAVVGLPKALTSVRGLGTVSNRTGTSGWTDVARNARAVVRDVEHHSGIRMPANQRAQLANQIRHVDHTYVASRGDYQALLREYNSQRRNLIREWELNTGQTWPKTASGVDYQAHHVIPRQYGGPNQWWNLHPVQGGTAHQGGIHGVDSPTSRAFPQHPPRTR